MASERPAAEPAWVDLPDERLLDLRLCDLGLAVRGELLETCIKQLRRELRGRGIRFRPHFWIGDEWFTPDGLPGIAIPFYLAHPRLARLEQNQMLEVEGGTREWCMRILRHETGHAIDNAYRLRRRRERQRVFGRYSVPYPDFYTPRRYSRKFVQHLEPGYAQAHPDEDFAETFAVWLGSEPDAWRRRYAGWPALEKLELMHRLVTEIAPIVPSVRSRRRVEPVERLEKTLRAHYLRKREDYGIEYPKVYDRQLRRLFSDAPEFRRNMPAATFVRRIRRDVRRTIAGWTGLYQYTIDQVLAEIIGRCKELGLRLAVPEDEARLGFGILLAVQTAEYLHNGRHRVAL